jgi:murein DD-endopeptidase MepM/ murein hydrolase activator NlpD
MRRTTRLRPGDRVLTGQRIGSIGDTGNARTIGCHLHFEIRVNGTPIDPAPELHAWDVWS